MILPTVISCASCGDTSAPPPIEISLEEPATPVVPPHRYELEEDGTYFYIAAVSEKDREEGRVAGSVLGYRYLGLDGDGEHILVLVDEQGKSLIRSTCAQPCVIIKDDDGERVAFNSDSIVGAAFTDAMNGHLKVHLSAAANAPAPRASPTGYPHFVSSIPQAFRGRWDELVQDGCRGREARFDLDVTKFYNFEVEWDVTNVKLYSATEMDLYTTFKDEDGGQQNEVWEFKLADGALTGRKPGTAFFRRCPEV
jgi:hypothetical protein